MSYPLVRFPFSYARGLSPNIWRSELDQYGDHTGEHGTLHYEDFVQENDGSAVDSDGSGEFRYGNGWYVQNSAAGGTNTNFANLNSGELAADGIARLAAATGTDWFGASAARTGKTVRLPTATVGERGRVVFEYRIGLDLADTYFVGLCEEVAEFLSTTGTLPTDSDYIGYYRLDAGNLLFVCANDNAGGTAVTDSVTVALAADIPDASGTLAKLAFSVDKDGKVELSIDGEPVLLDTDGNPIVIDPDALPIEALNEYIEGMRGATGDLATIAMDVDIAACWVAAR